jgi:hypothetical protein
LSLLIVAQIKPKGERNNWQAGDNREQRCLEYVRLNAERGSPSSVLQAIDDFGWNRDWLMNIGEIVAYSTAFIQNIYLQMSL